MQFRNLIFDLDGTLVDSLPGIEASTRYAVRQCLPGTRVPAMRQLIGPPIAKMFATLWPDLPPDRFDCLIAAFRQHYNNEGCRASACYPGVAESLGILYEREVKMFVLTNKPLAASRTILRHTGIAQFFADVVSPDSSNPPFTTKAEAAKALQYRRGISAEESALVGDGLDDAAAAASCGLAFILAGYGYGSATAGEARGAIYTLKSFAEILLFA